MKTSFFLVIAMFAVGLTYATVGDIGGMGVGGEGMAVGDVGAGASGGTGIGGRKGGVHSSGYDRSFSFGNGRDSGKTVNVGDEAFAGKGYGDKAVRELGLSGLGYGGYGYGGFRAPPLFFF